MERQAQRRAAYEAWLGRWHELEAAKFTCTDEEVLGAIPKAIEAWNERCKGGVLPSSDATWSTDIAQILAAWRPMGAKPSDAAIVTRRLKALEAQGSVERVGRKWETARWRISSGAASTRGS